MADAQQKAFAKLRSPCVALSSVTLKFRSQQASIKDILSSLEAVYAVLFTCSEPNVLDAKLAQYAFFPLSNIFNVAQKLSSRCLELAVRSLNILVVKGWGPRLEPEMGKQLLILMTLLAGRSPAASSAKPSEELVCACFECMTSLANILGKSKNVFDEPGAKTALDQSVYMLLEAATESDSELVQYSAVFTLRSILEVIQSRVLLASILPRTVSALTKVVTPTTQMRRRARIITASLDLLTVLLKAVLADAVALENVPSSSSEPDEDLVLDEKWLKATASQIKLALSNVIRHRALGKGEVQDALFRLCVMVCEFCSETLVDSLPLMLNTAVVLADPTQESSRARFHTLKRLLLTNPDLEYFIRDSLAKWVGRLPQVVQGHDERPKCLLLRQISTSVSFLLDVADPATVLDDGLALSLVESLATEIDQSKRQTSLAITDQFSLPPLAAVDEVSRTGDFPSLLLDQGGQMDLSVELGGLIDRIKSSSMQQTLTRSLLVSFSESHGSRKLSALYLCLHLLKADQNSTFSLSDMLDIPDEQDDSTASLISDLYSFTLPILLDSSTLSQQMDWRTTALALESIVIQAQQLQKSYRPELIDTLYPTLALFGSPEPRLQTHAITALNLLATACQYPDAATMLVDNVDYLINSIALRLNSFDLSPQGPLVLLMMLRLCGARILPYLDDMIGSIFVALDNFHGYPRLVELLFRVLSGVVDEAVKTPRLALLGSTNAPSHKKKPNQPSTMTDILSDVRAHKVKREARQFEAQADQTRIPLTPAPQQPWSTLDSPPSPADPSTPPPEPNDPDPPPFPKPHTLLLSIARSTIPHLTSPSPTVRLTLLTLLTNLAPLLATHENTFLPLINDLWPALLPRLFSPPLSDPQPRSNPSSQPSSLNTPPDPDPPFITAAALTLLAALCRGAGSFMTSRIHPILPRLETLATATRQRLVANHTRLHQPRPRGSNPNPNPRSKELTGTVSLRILPETPLAPSPSPSQAPSITTATVPLRSPVPPSEMVTATPSIPAAPVPSSSSLKTLHEAAVHALLAVVEFVGVDGVAGEKVMDVVGVGLEGGEGGNSGHSGKGGKGGEKGEGEGEEDLRREVRRVLEGWDADALWVWERKRRDMVNGEERRAA